MAAATGDVEHFERLARFGGTRENGQDRHEQGTEQTHADDSGNATQWEENTRQECLGK
jgi:hypothetical protein